MGDVPDGRPELRVCDADRDRAAEALREATGELLRGPGPGDNA